MTLWNEVRQATRTWRKTPALAVVVVVTLAFGIGVTTTAFTLAYSVLLRPLPFPEAHRLVWITSYNTRTSDGSELLYNSNRMSQFLDWQQHLTSFEQLAAWSGTAAPDVFTVTGAGRPERVNGLELTQQLLPMLGAKPALGRLFVEGEDSVGAARTVVLSYGYWQRKFGAAPDVVGRPITIDNSVHTIVGVLSREFPLSASVFRGVPIDLYLPLERNPNHDSWGYFMTVLGRLRRGVTIDHVRAELAARQAVLASTHSHMAAISQQVVPSTVLVSHNARSPLLLLLAGIGCVLLMACANIANLLLVRASGRRREMQVRVALGASTRHILHQTFTESAVLVIVGAAVGVAIAVDLTRVLRSASWLDVPRIAELEIAWPAVAFTLGVCALTTLVFGSLPLLHLRRNNAIDALRWHAGVTMERRATHVQRVSLAAQVAFAVLLTATGGLLFRSFTRLLDVHPGFTPRGVVALRVDPAGRLAPAARVPFFNNVLAAVSVLPGVESAALAINLPMDRNMGWDVEIPGRPSGSEGGSAFARIVSPGYFRTVGIPLITGRDFQPGDHMNAPLVMAINQTLARRLSTAGRDPLGATLIVNGRPREVIAVVADVKHQTLRSESGREFYIPHTQAPGWQAYDLVFRAAEPLALVPAIRDAIWRVDADQAVGTPVELQQLVDRSVRPHRVVSWLLGGFASIALIVAALGVYGVVGYRVAQRTREIAIRVALGATDSHVMSAVLRDTLTFVGAGLLAGIPLAFGAGTAVRAYLFGVGPRDLRTLTVACGVVLAATLLAAYLPARRARHVDPVAALRAE